MMYNISGDLKKTKSNLKKKSGARILQKKFTQRNLYHMQQIFFRLPLSC